MARAVKPIGKSEIGVSQKVNSERARALEIALGQIEKQIGRAHV